MMRIRTIALSAVGIFGSAVIAVEPSAPAVLPVIVPPITFLPAPQVLPSVTSDFTKQTPPAPQVPAPTFRRVSESPVFVPGIPEARQPRVEVITEPAPTLMTMPVVIPQVTIVEPKAEPLPVPLPVPLPASVSAIAEPLKVAPKPMPLPEPKQLPIPVATPKPTPAPAACEPPALEPLPGLMSMQQSRHGVFGSPSIRLSRESYFRDVMGRGNMTEPEYEGVSGANGSSRSGFLQLEYMLGWANPARIPALLTTNSLGQNGILGQPGTVNLLGPGTFGPSFADGMRVRGGQWYSDACEDPVHGWDASFFFLGNRSTSQTFNGAILTRPFFPVNINQEFVQVVAFPGVSTGQFLAQADRSLWGMDVNYKHALDGDTTRGWFVGYRHLRMKESLTMTEFITALGPPGTPDPAGTRVIVQDYFGTENRFNGGQLGWFSNRPLGQFDLDMRASVALGATNQVVNINGFQNVTPPNGSTRNYQGGLLAAGPNIGQFSNTAFSVVPEVTLNLGYAVRPNLRVYLGYNFLFWSNVARPGDQIDRGIDAAFIPNSPLANPIPTGQQRPTVPFTQANLYLNSLQFGANWQW